MAELKTKKTAASVEAFLHGVTDASKRADAFRLLEIMSDVTGEVPRMWGPSIVGFGEHHYVYASGREGDICLTGFAPRKEALTLYGLLGNEQSEALLTKLGKVKTGKGCLYIKRLEDVDLNVLRDMIRAALSRARAATPQPMKPEPAKPAKKAKKKRP